MTLWIYWVKYSIKINLFHATLLIRLHLNYTGLTFGAETQFLWAALPDSSSVRREMSAKGPRAQAGWRPRRLGRRTSASTRHVHSLARLRAPWAASDLPRVRECPELSRPIWLTQGLVSPATASGSGKSWARVAPAGREAESQAQKGGRHSPVVNSVPATSRALMSTSRASCLPVPSAAAGTLDPRSPHVPDGDVQSGIPR